MSENPTTDPKTLEEAIGVLAVAAEMAALPRQGHLRVQQAESVLRQHVAALAAQARVSDAKTAKAAKA